MKKYAQFFRILFVIALLMWLFPNVSFSQFVNPFDESPESFKSSLVYKRIVDNGYAKYFDKYFNRLDSLSNLEQLDSPEADDLSDSLSYVYNALDLEDFLKSEKYAELEKKGYNLYYDQYLDKFRSVLQSEQPILSELKPFEYRIFILNEVLSQEEYMDSDEYAELKRRGFNNIFDVYHDKYLDCLKTGNLDGLDTVEVPTYLLDLFREEIAIEKFFMSDDYSIVKRLGYEHIFKAYHDDIDTVMSLSKENRRCDNADLYEKYWFATQQMELYHFLTSEKYSELKKIGLNKFYDFLFSQTDLFLKGHGDKESLYKLWSYKHQIPINIKLEDNQFLKDFNPDIYLNQ